MDENEKLQVKGVNLKARQWQLIGQYAKDQGYPSLGVTLRRIVDEWERYRAECAQQQPAAQRN